MSPTLKARIHELVEAEKGGFVGRVLGFCIMSLISLNVIAVILETEKNLGEQYQTWFWGFECYSVAIFTIEYL
jgi:voltage-gated potassium channel